MESQERFLVVISNSCGVRTWAEYGNGDEFEKVGVWKGGVVVRKGIMSRDEAIALCLETLPEARYRAAVVKSNGDPEILRGEIRKQLWPLSEEGKRELIRIVEDNIGIRIRQA